jgi:hypothetical protein
VAKGYEGSVEYDARKGTYTVAGNGENMWFGSDAFHYMWKRASGDFNTEDTEGTEGTESSEPRRKG